MEDGLDNGKAVSSLLPSSLLDWLSWDLERLRNVFIAIYVVRDLGKMWLAVRNIRILSKQEQPPRIYEIPQNEASLKSWGEQRQALLAESRFLLLETLYDVNLNAAKIVSHYYPYLWNKTTIFGTSLTSRAIWFTVFDFLLNEIGRLVASCIIDQYHEGYSFHSRLFSVIPLLTSKIITMYISVVFFDLLGMKVIVLELIMYRIIRAIFLRPLLVLPTETIEIALNQRFPGAAEISDLARSLGYPKDRMLLDQGGSRPPKATYYNFVFFDRLVITRNTFIAMDPGQAAGIVAHELCHWKYGHAYIDHVCKFIVNIAKFYVYLIAYEDPRFAQFFRLKSAHPIIPLNLAYSLVWPVADDVIYGLANNVSAYKELRCDDFACKVVSPTKYREALVKLAPYRDFHPFDGWFSTWFHGMPSLMRRIKRVDKRIKRDGVDKTIHQNETYTSWLRFIFIVALNLECIIVLSQKLSVVGITRRRNKDTSIFS